MKKSIGWSLALMLVVLVLAACAPAAAPETEAPAPTEAPAEPTALPPTEVPPTPEPTAVPTIADIVVSNEDFSILLAAVQAAGLTETLADPEASFTVFAPTNAAFEALLAELGISAEELLADTETLTAVLTYHVVDGVFLAEDLLPASLVFTLNGPAQFYSNDMGAYINDAAISATDISAANGVIHVIDAVILPPAYETEATASIVETAVEAGSFTILAQALEAAGLVEVLSNEGPFTVFAPTDAAFEAALAELGITAEELLADTETLTDILLYHVVVGAYRSGDVLATDAFIMTNGAEAVIDAEGLTIAGVALNADALDIEASNGIIHVIDFVMLPPAE